MVKSIIKRDGRKALYDIDKIKTAIMKSMSEVGVNDDSQCDMLAHMVEKKLNEFPADKEPTVEEIQDIVEDTLIDNNFREVAKRYIRYRANRTRIREMNTRLMKIYDELTFADAKKSDIKRDNANIDGDTAMGTMLKYGSEGAKDYYEKYLLKPEQSKAHSEGDIHIHDFDFYTLTTTCCQIDLVKLFKGGFSTGHGYLREPNDIHSYSALACIAIQSNQNDQHGGQSIPNFDYGLAPGVRKTYKKTYASNLAKAIELLEDKDSGIISQVKQRVQQIEKDTGLYPTLSESKEYKQAEREALRDIVPDDAMYEKIHRFVVENSYSETDRATYQAMEALIHNLNTMHSRAGAQTPFSSINYGMDTSPEGRMVIRNVLLATEAGLGMGETAIFPIHIFKVKEGINYNHEDPNYDLFKLACRVSAKRLFPNFSFIDAPFNLQYYKQGHPETEIAYMGCRTRVIGNNYDKNNEVTFGRGNLSFTSINLPRIAIKSKGDVEWFFNELNSKMELVSRQLLDRFVIQSNKKVKLPIPYGSGCVDWFGKARTG